MTVLERIFQIIAFFAGSFKRAPNHPSIPEKARTVLPGQCRFILRPAARPYAGSGMISKGTEGIVWIGVWVGSDGVRVGSYLPLHDLILICAASTMREPSLRPCRPHTYPDYPRRSLRNDCAIVPSGGRRAEKQTRTPQKDRPALIGDRGRV